MKIPKAIWRVIDCVADFFIAPRRSSGPTFFEQWKQFFFSKDITEIKMGLKQNIGWKVTR